MLVGVLGCQAERNAPPQLEAEYQIFGVTVPATPVAIDILHEETQSLRVFLTMTDDEQVAAFEWRVIPEFSYTARCGVADSILWRADPFIPCTPRVMRLDTVSGASRTISIALQVEPQSLVGVYRFEAQAYDVSGNASSVVSQRFNLAECLGSSLRTTRDGKPLHGVPCP